MHREPGQFPVTLELGEVSDSISLNTHSYYRDLKVFSRTIRGKMILVLGVIAIGMVVGYLLQASLLFGTVEKASPAAEGAVPDDGVVPASFFLEIGGEIVTALAQVSGISAETDVIESKQGNSKEVEKLAGDTNYSNVVLRRSLTEDMTLSDWFDLTASGNPDKKDASIVISDIEGQTIARFNFTNAWPCKYDLSPFDAASNESIIETVELCHERMTRVAP